jgi:Leu/Phe-tRNA-protein transferase
VSTSSKYSPNKLKQVINDGTQHFILKCYISAAFDYDRKKSEYYLYWYNRNAGIDLDTLRYRCLSNKKMGKNEIKYFSSIINDYRAEVDSEDGTVWVNKSIGFNKSNVIITQMILWS